MLNKTSNTLLQWIETADGSLTLKEEETGELYHNRAGAYAEALQHYVTPSSLLNKICETEGETEFSVVDVCFGLGYNTWVLLNELNKLNFNTKQNIALTYKKLNIYWIENDSKMFSLSLAVLKQPFFEKSGLFDVLCSFLEGFEHNIYYQTLLEEAPKTEFTLQCGLRIGLQVFCGDLRQILPTLPLMLKGNLDAIFHDPFSPAKIPELWTLEIFEVYMRLLKPTGRILTYSTAGAVWGAMNRAGFSIYQTSALGGKRGGTVASKVPVSPSNLLSPLSPKDQRRIKGQAGIPFRDPGWDASRETIREDRLSRQTG